MASRNGHSPARKIYLMNRSLLSTLACGLFLAASPGQTAAQSFNVDFGDPMSAAGPALISAPGAAGQTGVWNHLGASVNWSGLLNDLMGNPTPVFLSLSTFTGVNDFEDDNPLTTSNEETVLDDLIDIDDLTIFINNLENGTYEVTTYAWAPDAPVGNFTNVLVSPSPFDPSVDVGGADWTGSYVEGEQYARHRVRVQSGAISIALSPLVGSFGSCNGLQIVKLADEFTSSCDGDAGPLAACTPCPCLNNAAPGTSGGCVNSAGLSSELIGWGVPSVMDDSVNFSATGAQPNSFAILVSGASIAPTNPSNPCFGTPSGIQSITLDGLRCAVLSLRRHGTRTSDGLGQVNPGWGVVAGPSGGLAANGGFVAGETRHFQLFYRDDPTLGCGTGLNTSQVVTVDWLP